MAEQGSLKNQRKKRGSNMGMFWFLVITVLLLIVALPTIIILVIGMLPAFVAYIVDNTKQKYAALSVGSMNFCGVFPALFEIWTGTHTIDGSLTVLLDPFTLMVMYAGAAFGWVFFMSIPMFVSTFLTVVAQHRISHLRDVQKRLIGEWGEEVQSADGK